MQDQFLSLSFYAALVYLHNEANGFEYLKEFLGTTAI